MNFNINMILFPLLLTGSASAETAPARRVQYLMGTLCEITAYGPNADAAVTAAFAEIARWDRVLSLYKKESELSALNRSNGAWFACSDALWEALAAAEAYAKASGGAFDATILPVLSGGKDKLALVGHAKLELDERGRRARFRRPGMGLDSGGFGKGLALDHAARVLRDHGVSSAFINFGGQVYALGAPPNATAWPVRVAGTDDVLFVRDASVSTSGNAEQPGHIASPFTGERLLGAYSATVVAPSATAADAWSTALFVLGPDAPPAYAGCYLFGGRKSGSAPACAPFFSTHNKGGRS